ncbi:MAG: peptide deformylase [Patescibacteria group bacterium]
MEDGKFEKPIKILIDGHKVLTEQAQEVVDMQSKETKAAIDKLFLIMKQTGAMGFAAPQIGIPLRIFIFSSYPHVNHEDAPQVEPTVVINPIIHTFSNSKENWEKCYSLPGKRGLVPRFEEIIVSYTQKDGQRIDNLKLSGFPAELFQHEYDHLKGLLYTARNLVELITDEEYKNRYVK